jgi:hypothetical protein
VPEGSPGFLLFFLKQRELIRVPRHRFVNLEESSDCNSGDFADAMEKSGTRPHRAGMRRVTIFFPLIPSVSF